MKNKLLILLCLLLAVAGLAGLKVPSLTGRVVDQAHILSDSGEKSVEQAIIQLEKATGGQMAVLTISSLEGEALEEFSIKVAEAWKIGHKEQDNGAILIVSKADRKIRLEVGYGWEGAINDARAGDIIRSMGPHFRQGNFDQGIILAVARVQEFVTGKKAAYAPARESVPGVNPLREFIIVSIFLAGFTLILVFIFRWSAYGTGITIYTGGTCRGGRYYRGGGGFGGGGFSGGSGSFGGGGASGGW